MLRRAALAVVCLTAAVACAEPPTKERHQAEGALAAARAADAATYAPVELADAEAALSRYDQAVAQHDYRQALRHALEARDHAHDAVREAGDRKAAARGEAERLLAELERLQRAGAARLAGTAQPRLTGAAAERVRALLAVIPDTLQEARTHVTDGGYRAAVERLGPVVERIQQELAGGAPPAGRRGR